MPLHLIKLAVGIADLDHLRTVQARRIVRRPHGGGVVPVHTRRVPTRADAVLDGGSLFWVIRGAVLARQRIVAIDSAVDDEGRGFCVIQLDPDPVETVPVPHRPFQGWRYLEPAAAPPDRTAGDGDPLPPHLAADLRALGLL